MKIVFSVLKSIVKKINKSKKNLNINVIIRYKCNIMIKVGRRDRMVVGLTTT